MSKERDLFRNLLLWIWDNHQKPWEYVGQPGQIFQKISGLYPSFGATEDFESLLPTGTRQNGDFAERRRFLYLDPVNEGGVLVPLLSARWDFGRSIPEVRLRLGMFVFDENQEVMSFGYRLEAPEGEGKHHYCHTQFIRDIDQSGRWMLSSPSWFPTGSPAFPLDADNCIALVVCLLTSLYGVLYLSKLQPRFRGVLDKYIGAMMLSKIPTSTYWEVKTKKGIHYYKTRHGAQQIQRQVRSEYAVQAFKQIERDEYLLQSPSRRRVL